MERFEDKAYERQRLLFAGRGKRLKGIDAERLGAVFFADFSGRMDAVINNIRLTLPDAFLAHYGLVDRSIADISTGNTNHINKLSIMEEHEQQKGTPQMQQVLDGVKQIYAEHLSVNDILDTDTVDALGGDSLDSADIAMSIEKKFGVRVTDAEAAGMSRSTVAEQAKMVYDKLCTLGEK